VALKQPREQDASEHELQRMVAELRQQAAAVVTAR
jgi:hypothetical protein